MSEYFKVLWVRYEPNLEQVQVEGIHIVVTPSGVTLKEPKFFMTTQTELESFKPEGASTWSDNEVMAVVTAKFNIPCVFQDNTPPVAP